MGKKKVDLEAKFLNIWRMLSSGEHTPERQYHFTRTEVGDNPHPPARPGLRKRLAAAGFGDWAFDFCFPEHKISIEIDGGQWAPGGGRHNTDGDRDKLNKAAALGWRVMRFSGTMLNDPTAVVAVIEEGLNKQGVKR